MNESQSQFSTPCGGWPSEEEIARTFFDVMNTEVCMIDPRLAPGDWNEDTDMAAAGRAAMIKAARAVLSALPRLQWPSEEVDRIARILDPIAFIKVKAAEAGRGDLSIVRYQNRCRDARKLAGEVLSALPRPPSDGWLKMESAPTDGMPILAVIEDQRGRRHVEIVSWAGAWTPYDRHPICWQHIPDPPERVSHSTMQPGKLPSEIK